MPNTELKDEIKEYAGAYRVMDIRRNGDGIHNDSVCAILVMLGEYDNTKIGVVKYDGNGGQYQVIEIGDEDRDDLREHAKSRHPKFANAQWDLCTGLFIERLINYTEDGLLTDDLED